MQIIAIGHYKRVGKDTFSDYLIQACYERNPKLRVGKMPWAYKLKQVCHELYGWAGLREPEFYETATGAALREVILPDLGKSPRRIWIDLGTAAVREQVYDRTWLDYLLKSQHALDVLIIPDTRFLNEIEAVHEAGGISLKVVRPGFGPGKDKADRQLVGYRDWHNVIGETGLLSDLRLWADRYANWLCGGAEKPTRTAKEMAAACKVEIIEPWEDDPEQQIIPDHVARWMKDYSALLQQGDVSTALKMLKEAEGQPDVSPHIQYPTFASPYRPGERQAIYKGAA